MNKIWEIFESSAYFIVYRVLGIKMKEATWEKFLQFVKFGIVGLSNTLISYIIYVILVSINIHYLAASMAGFLVSVVNAYYWNNKYVFETGEKEVRVWWKVFMKTFLSYAGTGLILNNILLVIWINVLGVHELIGPVINLFITIPLNFLLNKYWAFKGKR